ncbi:hypothetical protein G7046_g5737 [Stylonectria norvegica]|nr:hypothetical protein G7046_g5737 [Stylonectria norvegica]
MSSSHKLTLYTNHACPWAHRAHIVLAELGLPFEEKIIDLSTPRTAEYLKINPRGLVPTLVYDGEIITESGIVAQFLADAYPSHLVPASNDKGGALKRARIAFFVDAYLSKANSHVFKFFSGASDEELVIAGQEFTKAIVKEVEPLLADAAPYFGGSEKLTLAEALTGSFVLRLFAFAKGGVIPQSYIEELSEKAPHFYKWSQKVINHPSVTGIWDNDANIVKAKEHVAKIRAACDFCHHRGVKCRDVPLEYVGASNSSSCLTCIEYGRECTRNRQPKKRGTKPQAANSSAARHERIESQKPPAVDKNLDDNISRLSNIDDSGTSALGNRKVITALLDVYLDTIHPTFPFFCERQIWVGWRDGTFPGNPSDYMSLMCMCALSAQHVGNGALFSDDTTSSEGATLAHDYLHEATRLVPIDFEEPNINLIRSYAFLALLGAQNGNSPMAHKYLGLYHGICALYNLHDELRWPNGIDECDTEVRRRIWWAMYRLEVHMSCVLGNLIRCSETQCNVGYPSGPHHPAFIPGRDGEYEDWFSGWNSTTDLYRVLEHAVFELRAKRRPRPSILQGQEGAATKTVMDRLFKIQQELLPQFEAASSRSSDSGRNRCGFQASNILCTIHLARMILSISGEASLPSACETARYMMEKMDEIPLEYIRAVGSPLLQQLAGVGYMLVGVAKKHSISQKEYAELRGVLITIIHFLMRFNEYSKVAKSAQERLSSQVAELDDSAKTALEEDGTVQTDSGAERLDWSSFLDIAELDYNEENGFWSTNLLRSFTWPHPPKEFGT